MHNVNHGNLLDWCAAYEGEPFHALLCDPPYHLTSITERFGKGDSAPAQYGSDGAFQRASRGFMGRQWDGGDIAFQPETWAALAQHLYPGAFGMAFASARGWHRMAVAIEDAGLIIHPSVWCWNYATGFPKATQISAAIDKAAGAVREVIGANPNHRAISGVNYEGVYAGGNTGASTITAPATPLARAWAGHRYGLQAIKPSVEPVIIFQKPYQGRPIDCITTTGAGAFNIDGARIGGDSTKRRGRAEMGYHGGNLADDYITGSDTGRWPANLVLSHHPRCEAECHEACAVRRMGEMSGDRKTGGKVKGTEPSRPGQHGIYNTYARAIAHTKFGDTGTAARFFYNADWMYERLELSDPVGYFAKASSAEREAGLDPMQIGLMRELYGDDLLEFPETTVDDGRETPIDNPYLRGETERRNTHPTIKPIALTRWLATLLLPPAEYAPRRLLVPFSGAGSEMIGAMLAGWEHSEGIELEADHVRIAQARLRYWEQMRHKFDAGQPVKIRATRKVAAEQPTLF